ncbi:hypothetical protein [Lentilitoribacter sp. EG35]|uniref:hypothetical protein n=1 Tax=Lentilitoribacter sp. EG35 TaxID=3234192 RepID=UPI003460F8AD
MAVRAKFFVKEVKHMQHSSNSEQLAEIAMAPVYADGEENAVWSKYTPSGELSMLITNEDAISQFELGGEYFLDITPVEKH